MKTRTILSVCIFLSALAACTKEGPPGPAGPQGPGGNGSIDPAIYAKWEVVSGLPGTKYFIIKTDNSFCQLDSLAYGFKSLYSDMAFITGSQIAAGFGVYNYAISNDTLRLSNSIGTVILKKNANAPDETQWTIAASITDSIPSPVPNGDGREDLGFDGTNILWAADASVSALCQINPVTHAVSGTIPLSANYYYPSVNYASASVWVSNGTAIDKVNPASGAILSTSPALSANAITAMALVGQDMWYCDWQGALSKWDIISNAVTPQFQLEATGMEYVNGYLYIVRYNMLYKCQLSPFMAVATYALPVGNHSYHGLTHDGTHFWVVQHRPQNTCRLVKLTI